MKRLFVAALALTITVSATAQKKPKQTIPDEVLKARYVAVVVYNDRGFARNEPDDLRAQSLVEQALRKWGRYTVTMNVADADFVIAVRTDRMGSARIGTVATSRPPVTLDTEITMPGDMFAVYRTAAAGDFRDAPPIWRKVEKGILAGPSVTAVDAFRRAVEESDQVAAQKKKP